MSAREIVKPITEAKEFEEEILAQIRQTVFSIQSSIGRYIGMTQVRVILLLGLSRSQEMSQADLQQRFGVDRSEVTRIIKQMEEDGWITRRADPSDNRFTLVQLTKAGREQQQAIMAKNRSMKAILLQGLSREDMLITQRTLARMYENAERLAIEVESSERVERRPQ